MGSNQDSRSTSRFEAQQNSTGILEVLAGEVDSLVNASLAENTVKLYKLAVKQFDAFCTEYKLSPSWLPPLNHVVNFVAYLSCKGYSFSTASSYVSGIAFQLKINGFNDVTDSFLIRKMLKGFHKARPTRDTRAPVTIDMLKLLPRALDAVCSSKYESLLFSTIFSVAFFWLPLNRGSGSCL